MRSRCRRAAFDIELAWEPAAPDGGAGRWWYAPDAIRLGDKAEAFQALKAQPDDLIATFHLAQALRSLKTLPGSWSDLAWV